MHTHGHIRLDAIRSVDFDPTDTLVPGVRVQMATVFISARDSEPSAGLALLQFEAPA